MVANERYFTVSEANALVPKLEGLLERLSELYEEVAALFSEFSSQGVPPREEEGSPDDPEDVKQKRAQLRDLAAELQEGINDVNAMGCILKDVESGLVDFLSRRAGRTVHLCWRRGEPEVSWWHDLESGYQGRRPISTADEFEGSYLH